MESTVLFHFISVNDRPSIVLSMVSKELQKAIKRKKDTVVNIAGVRMTEIGRKKVNRRHVH